MHDLPRDMLAWSDAETIVHVEVGEVDPVADVVGLQAREKVLLRPDAAEGFILGI